MNRRAILYALVSAILFGASTPGAKVLVGTCGAGIGAAALRRLLPSIVSAAREAPITHSQLPWLAGAIGAGGVIGPLLLMDGLVRTDAATASLLLTLEGVATALMAWFLFHENFDRRIALGMVCLLAGGGLLAWTGNPKLDGTLLGPLAIVGACIAWGIDNNLTRKVSLADPLQIVALKGLVAGPVNLLLGLWAGASLPNLPSVAAAAFIGFLCYGVSLALYVLALRHLGTARSAAYFSVAPFVGATVAVIFLNESVTAQLIVGGLFMAFGVWLHVTERHEHEHVHETQVHSHSHIHDKTHLHSHEPSDPAGEPHTHLHVHEGLKHSHQHTPDMHHQHRH